MKIIIDCHNIGYMAHYGTGELSAGDVRTGVIFGFLRTIFSIADRFDSNQFIFCWDSKQSFRLNFYSGYKRDRREKEKELPDEEVQA